MTDTANVHLLFTQLQTRYPTSSLVSELVQVHGDRFIVRALVQLGGVILATGMAAAATIEQAEDQARLRVLHVLGIGAIGGSPVSFPVSRFTQPSGLSTPPLQNGGIPPIEPMQPPPQDTGLGLPLPSTAIPPSPLETPPVSNPVPRPQPGPAKPGSPDLQPLQERSPVSASVSAPVDPDPIETPLDNPVFAQPDAPSLDEVQEIEDSLTSEPVDLSELIALTDVEMERIGWGKKRGQSHLKRTYGKQTRAELNEDQLLEFLHYLRALPSQTGA